MNKHIIILPILLASAISLHVLSMYLEEPVNIADNGSASPSPSSQLTVTPTIQPTTQVTDVKETPKVKETSEVKPTDVKETPKVEESKQPTVKATPEPIKATPEPVKPSVTGDVKPTPIETPTIVEPIKVAVNKLGFIRPKPFSEILEEAKMIGGRLDPFLELTPPEVKEEIPEIPQELKDFVQQATLTKQQSKNGKMAPPPTFNGKTVPTPPIFAQNEKDRTKPTTNTSTSTTLSKLPDLPKGNNNQVNKTTTKTKQGEDVIEFTSGARLKEGLILTGIIIGEKPVAIMTVDNESKIFKIGDMIRPSQKLRLVSIDFRSKSITVLDNRNRKARIEIKE